MARRAGVAVLAGTPHCNTSLELIPAAAYC